MNANFDKIRLRWRFNYAARPSKYGMWSRPAEHAADMAAFNNQSDLVSAEIEAQDIASDRISVVAECPGSDFVNFEWVAAAIGFTASVSSIVGLTLVTRSERCSVYVDGSAAVTHRSDADKQINLATFGK